MISPIEVTPSAVPKSVKVVRVSATARKQLVFKLTDAEGRPIDLTQEVSNPPAGPPNIGTQPSIGTSGPIVRLKAKDGDLYGPTQFDITGNVLSEPGFVSFQLLEQHTGKPGVYPAEIGRFAGDYLVDSWPCIVIIEPSVFQTLSGSGPISIPEIRLALLDDNDGADNAPFNSLLDGVEFSDIEIANAIRRCVDLWNETPPSVAWYTPHDFPYRYWWIMGTSAILFRAAAARYRRNRLAYSAGGVSVDDQSKAQEYEQIGETRMREFREWMQSEKVRINMGFCWSRGL